MRPRWGIARPIQPMSIPRVLASLSPRERMLIRQRMSRSTTMAVIIGGDMSRQTTPARLPNCQWVMEAICAKLVELARAAIVWGTWRRWS